MWGLSVMPVLTVAELVKAPMALKQSTADQSTDLSSLDKVLAKNGQDLESSLIEILTLSAHHTLDPVVEDSRAPYSF